jgi:hypothetical protein
MRSVVVLLVALTSLYGPSAEATLCAHGKKQIVRVRVGACSANESPVPAEDLGQGAITGALPSGVTLRGTFGLDFAASATSEIAEGAISFGLTLASAPTPIVRPVDAVPNEDCPGTAAAPEAAAGKLCLYEATAYNVEFFDVLAGDETPDAASPFGALLFLNALIVPSRAYVDGSWAVTAP